MAVTGDRKEEVQLNEDQIKVGTTDFKGIKDNLLTS